MTRQPIVRLLPVVLLAAMISVQPTFAKLGSIDNEPAATLLIPYFAVDVSDAACADSSTGVTTLFSVGNIAPFSVVAHAQLWTDWGVPWFDFDIFLTGYDVQTINLRDLFCNGLRPVTGLGSGNSPVGSFSNASPTYADTCNQTAVAGEGPFYEPLDAMAVDQLKTAFTGRPITGLGTCGGSGQLGSDVAIGYVTIDVVTQCSVQINVEPGYFSTIASFSNVLLGDVFLADPGNNFSQGFTAVHLQAGSPGPHTFYGRYTIANGEGPAVDGREPLPTTLMARFVEGGGFDETVHFIWREVGPESTTVTCGSRPDWFPLGQNNATGAAPVIVFDEEENPTVPTTAYFPHAVNVVSVGATAGGDLLPKLDTGGTQFGWIIYNLQSDATVSTYGDSNAQAYVLNTIRALGRFSVGMHPFVLDNANSPAQVNPGN